jgi:hypothetical protein
MATIGFYLCIDGVLTNSQVLAGSGGILLGIGMIGIGITIEYRHEETPQSPTIIIIEQENPTNIVQKDTIRQVDITGLDPSTV